MASEMTSGHDDEHLERVIAAACRLLGGRAGSRTVTVVAGRRLTYRELSRLRRVAARHAVALTMDGGGQVTLRHATAEASQCHRRQVAVTRDR